MACGPRRGRGGTGSDSGRVPARPELGDDPDRRGPPVGRPRVRGAKPRWAGRKNKLGQRNEGSGPQEMKKRKGEGWAGLERV